MLHVQAMLNVHRIEMLRLIHDVQVEQSLEDSTWHLGFVSEHVFAFLTEIWVQYSVRHAERLIQLFEMVEKYEVDLTWV